MPHVIGRVGKSSKSVDVGRDTFKTLNKLAIRLTCRTASSSDSDFINNIFRNIVKKNLPLNEKTIKRYIETL